MPGLASTAETGPVAAEMVLYPPLPLLLSPPLFSLCLSLLAMQQVSEMWAEMLPGLASTAGTGLFAVEMVLCPPLPLLLPPPLSLCVFPCWQFSRVERCGLRCCLAPLRTRVQRGYRFPLGPARCAWFWASCPRRQWSFPRICHRILPALSFLKSPSQFLKCLGVWWPRLPLCTVYNDGNYYLIYLCSAWQSQVSSRARQVCMVLFFLSEEVTDYDYPVIPLRFMH